MNPRLIAITGSSQGSTFELDEDETSIGRDAANGVRLADVSVSRRHALIRREGEQFRLLDLESFNGTFVNGVPVTNRLIEHGDQVAFGDVLLLFLQRETDQATAGPAVSLEAGINVTQSVVRLPPRDSLYLHPEKMRLTLGPTDRIARDLSALLRIGLAINSIRDFEEFQRRLLELTLEIIPADRGAIVLIENGSERLAPSAYLTRRPLDQPMRVSQSAALLAIREGVAILSNDVATNESLGSVDSLITANIRALMCVPLMLLDRCLGVIYLDTEAAGPRFDEHHLQLLTAIAGSAAGTVDSMHRYARLESDNRRLNEEINIKHQMVGESRPMRQLYQLIAKVAPTDSTVLIRGESGTGKELAARAIHNNSSRAAKLFIAINCATLTETLLESELFGHEKGAFTGAVATKRGKFEVAEGGTVFLDEVGELVTNIQAKLLRVLQDRTFERVGGTHKIKANIRVVAATNKDLEKAVEDGSFRRDLYYRLNVITCVAPPLRARREDIPLLASYFAVEHSRRAKRETMRLSAEARAYLMSYDWPGNVRELENVIERAVVLGSSDLILPEDLPETIIDSAASPTSKLSEAIRETKRQLVLKALRQNAGSYAEAAKFLGIRPNNLHRLIRNLDLRKELDK